jgi:asparagine synthase (glutamine-hydrolysing)
MASAEGRYWLCYNGELYNHRALRRDLEVTGVEFRTSSDAEVALQALVRWQADALRRFEGIFSCAFFDSHTSELLLAVDPLGVKPLYYCESATAIEFCSDFRGLLPARLDEGDIDVDGLSAYLALRYVPGAKTIVRGVYKLQPGTFLRWRDGALMQHAYWQPSFAPDHARCSKEWVPLLRETFCKSVTTQWQSDVDNAVLLSGGFDSSAIVGALSAAGITPRTYSCSFGQEGKGKESLPQRNHEFGVVNSYTTEAEYARLVAKHFGTAHTHCEIDLADVEADFVQMVRAMGEPMASIDALGHFILAKKIDRNVKVLLNGVGSDELFGGYTDIYFGRHGRHLRQGLAPIDYIRMLCSPDSHCTPLVDSLETCHRSLAYAESEFQRALMLSPALKHEGELINETALVFMMAADLPWWELKQADAVYMAASHEVRVPYLSADMVALACQIPSHLKYKPDREKRVLKAALASFVPRPVLSRAKCPSLGLPVRALTSTWFRKLLHQAVDRPPGFFDTARLRGICNATGSRDILDHQYRLVVLNTWWQLACAGEL